MGWDDFIGSSGRNVQEETHLRDKRRDNQVAFDREFGQETWLLDGSGSSSSGRGGSRVPRGVARLESKLSIAPVASASTVKFNPTIPIHIPIPRIFNNWKSTVTDRQGDVDMYIHTVYTEELGLPHVLHRGSGSGSGGGQGQGQGVGDSTTSGTPSGSSGSSSGSSGSPSGSFVPSSYVSTPLPPGEYSTIRHTLLSGHTQRGYDMLMVYYTQYSQHPQYLMELGLVEYFRGNYQMSYGECVYGAYI